MRGLHVINKDRPVEVQETTRYSGYNKNGVEVYHESVHCVCKVKTDTDTLHRVRETYWIRKSDVGSFYDPWGVDGDRYEREKLDVSQFNQRYTFMTVKQVCFTYYLHFLRTNIRNYLTLAEREM